MAHERHSRYVKWIPYVFVTPSKMRLKKNYRLRSFTNILKHIQKGHFKLQNSSENLPLRNMRKRPSCLLGV